jgi:hypothetical protein
VNGGVRRAPIVIALVVAGVVALLVGNSSPEPSRAVAETPDAASLAAPGTRSSAWFCPGLPTSVPLDAQTLTVSNIGSQPATTVVTVYPDDGSAPVSQTISVPADSAGVLARPALGPAGGVAVEAFARGVVVENGVESSERFAVGPCTSRASTDWYFAAGTTGNFQPGTEGRPVEQWITLFNPFGTDARVQVTLRENEAVPDVLETIDVPRRMRVVVPIHEHAVRKPQVAVETRAASGRVVASQTMIFGEQSGYSGVTLSSGAPAPASTWTFADGGALADTQTDIAIVNPGLLDTDVDVTVSAAAVPLTVHVKRDAVVWVQIGGCGNPPGENCVPVPDGAPYSAVVSSDVDSPIVAEQLVFAGSDADAGGGVAAVMGNAHPSDGGVFARGLIGAGRHAVLAVANPGAVPVRVTVRFRRGGEVEVPDTAHDVEIAPGQRGAFDLSALLGPNDAAVSVSATGPVVVERTVTASDDQTRSGAILTGAGRPRR